MEIEKNRNKKKILVIGGIVLVAVIISGILGSILYTNSEGYKVKKSLELGNKYLSEIQYEQAIAVYEEILEIEPENVEAKVAIVKAYLEIIEESIDNKEYDIAQEWAETAYENTENEQVKEKVDMFDSGNIVDADGNVIKKTIYNFDGTIREDEFEINGNRSKLTFYNTDGILEYYCIIECDENGNEIKCSSYKADGILDSYESNEYDKNGNEIKCSSYNVDGMLDSYELTEYDKNGKKVKNSFYNADDILISYNIFFDGGMCKYDENERMIEKRQGNEVIITEYDLQGHLIAIFKYESEELTRSYEFELDEEGNVTKYIKNFIEYGTARYYQYNSKGYLTKCSNFDSENVTSYKADNDRYYIFEYDSKGNMIQETEYIYRNDNFLLGGYLKYSYDNDGNKINILDKAIGKNFYGTSEEYWGWSDSDLSKYFSLDSNLVLDLESEVDELINVPPITKE